METPTLEEIQSFRQFIDDLTTPKKDLTQLNLAIDAALQRKDFSYAFGLAVGSNLSALGMNATEFAEAYLKIRSAFTVELNDTAIPAEYDFLEHDYVKP